MSEPFDPPSLSEESATSSPPDDRANQADVAPLTELRDPTWTRARYTSLRVAQRGTTAYVMLARPDVHNAFNPRMIAELRDVFATLDGEDGVRAVVLQGDGRSFCAGADLSVMRDSLAYSREENVADALRMADMFRAIDACRHPVIARVHGAALGGGAGLVAVADIAIAAEDTRFGFTEARLGIAPAVISPFVVRKLGEGQARALFLTAERFTAERALTVGLVHRVVPNAEMDDALDETLRAIGQGGPTALRVSKLLARTVGELAADEAREMTAATIADLRTGPEGQEGLRAFLEKRPATWITDEV